MAEKNVFFVTGASRGIGLEFVRVLASEEKGEKNIVVAACRNPNSAAHLQALAAQTSNIFIIKLDIADNNSVNTLELPSSITHLDVLINNAGISLPNHPEPDYASETDVDMLATLFNTNVLGTLRVTQALLPFLTINSSKFNATPVLAKVVNISSNMGSINNIRKFGPDMPYYTSYNTTKAGLNMLTAQFAREFTSKATTISQQREVSFLAMCPGWVGTDLGSAGGRTAPLTPNQSVTSMLQVINRLTMEQSGSFVNNSGETILY